MRRILALIPLAALAVSPGVAVAPALETGRVRIVTNDEAEMTLAHSALDRFEVAGLVLPEITIEFVGPSLAPCGGSQAIARLSQDPITVSVCWGDPFVLLHELAHVWEATSVDDAEREQFMDLRDDVRSWANPSDAWKDRGREHAANVIAWGLSEIAPIVGRTYPNDRSSLTAAFIALTGQEPLHTFGGEPVQPDRSSLPPPRPTPRATGT